MGTLRQNANGVRMEQINKIDLEDSELQIPFKRAHLYSEQKKLVIFETHPGSQSINDDSSSLLAHQGQDITLRYNRFSPMIASMRKTLPECPALLRAPTVAIEDGLDKARHWFTTCALSSDCIKSSTTALHRFCCEKEAVVYVYDVYDTSSMVMGGTLNSNMKWGSFKAQVSGQGYTLDVLDIDDLRVAQLYQDCTNKELFLEATLEIFPALEYLFPSHVNRESTFGYHFMLKDHFRNLDYNYQKQISESLSDHRIPQSGVSKLCGSYHWGDALFELADGGNTVIKSDGSHGGGLSNVSFGCNQMTTLQAFGCSHGNPVLKAMKKKGIHCMRPWVYLTAFIVIITVIMCFAGLSSAWSSN